MAEKNIIAKVTVGVHCPKGSVPLRDPETKKAVPGEFASVVLLHVPAGEKIAIDADEADALIERGVATEVGSETGQEPAGPAKTTK